MYFDVKRHAEDLNAIGVGMNKAVEQRLKSERLQILGQLFQPAGLPVKHQQVLLCGVRKVLLLQQIHVVDG